MKTSIHSIATETFVPMLRSLSNILDKGAEHARASKSDPAALVNARLAPDMYPPPSKCKSHAIKPVMRPRA